ncbi:hypothetical protein FRC01_001055 [Tulasnella sp. 417]|nr:hypothetical protein FRC01_001055 [Tulasnella sp. 417]
MWLPHRRKSKRSIERVLDIKGDALRLLSCLLQKSPYDLKDLDDRSPIIIVHKLIIPRIEKLTADISQNRDALLQSSLTSRAERTANEKYERRARHAELMLYLVKNQESFGPTFWASIISWQMMMYRRSCIKLLEAYRDSASRHLSGNSDGAKVFMSALETAVQRANALPEPDPEKAEISDAFSIRSIYNDPDLGFLVGSAGFSLEKRLGLQQMTEDILLQQPMFPPECYALQING